VDVEVVHVYVGLRKKFCENGLKQPPKTDVHWLKCQLIKKLMHISQKMSKEGVPDNGGNESWLRVMWQDEVQISSAAPFLPCA
jgi:hypothetical protein